MKITNLKRRVGSLAAALGMAGVMALNIGVHTAGATGEAATNAEISALEASCPSGSLPAVRAWNGTSYAAYGAGFAGLRSIAPSAVPLTISKPYEVAPGTGVYVQALEIGTKHNTTIVAGGYLGYNFGNSTLPAPQGYEQALVNTMGAGIREYKAVGVCVAAGGEGEQEHPDGGFLPIDPSNIY